MNSNSRAGPPPKENKPIERPSDTDKSNDTNKDSKWCCEMCTFLSEGDSCQMCGAPKPA